MKYFFVLGRNPTLSLAEIISVLDLQKINYLILHYSTEVVIIGVSLPHEVFYSALIKILGGTVKIGKIIQQIKLDENEQNFQNIFSADNLIHKFLSTTEGKLHLGLSIYDGGGDREYLKNLVLQLKSLNVLTKENLQDIGIKIGFVRIKERYLSSVSVAKNKLLTKGVEIVLILTKDEILVGKTLAVQEFEEFSFRDYQRPQKDKRSGIMPPKLARIMINLAQVKKDSSVLDPFCGSGTILQEAIILGHKNIVGSDISGKAIEASQKNIDWLFRGLKELNKSSYNIRLFQTDVRSIFRNIRENSVDAIVTEPYLGPPLYRKPDLKTIKKILTEVSELYLQAFRQFSKILKPKGKIIIIFPAFAENGRMHYMDVLDKIKAMGFGQIDFFPKDFREEQTVKLTDRNTILYGSLEQFIIREILSFLLAE